MTVDFEVGLMAAISDEFPGYNSSWVLLPLYASHIAQDTVPRPGTTVQG